MPGENSPIICIGEGEDELSLQEQALHEALLSQHQAVPVGAATRLPHAIGNRWPVDAGSRVGEYHPEDLVVTVGASMRIDDLARVLGLSNQWHGLVLPDHGQDTLGGIIALGLEGWFRSAMFRDRILGLRVITPAFGPISTGAKVVKSVAGYNLPRLFLGSRGGLGLITEVTLRVSPKPPAQQIWIQDIADPAASISTLMNSDIPWASVGLLRQSGRLVAIAVWTGAEELGIPAERLGRLTESALLPRLNRPEQGWLTYGAVPLGRILDLLTSWPPDHSLFCEVTTGGFWGHVADAAEAREVRALAERLGGLASTPFLRPTAPPAPWWKTLKQSFDPDGCLWDPWA